MAQEGLDRQLDAGEPATAPDIGPQAITQAPAEIGPSVVRTVSPSKPVTRQRVMTSVPASRPSASWRWSSRPSPCRKRAETISGARNGKRARTSSPSSSSIPSTPIDRWCATVSACAAAPSGVVVSESSPAARSSGS